MDGGGLLTTAWKWLTDSEMEKRDFLRDQLDKLYGPMHHQVTANQHAIALRDDIDNAYTQVFVKRARAECRRGIDLGESYEAGELLTKKASKTIDQMNVYGKKVRETNDRIAEILEANWSLPDPEDLEVFQDFRKSHARAKAEEEGGLPREITLKLGPTTIYTSTFVDHVVKRFAEKRRDLDELLKPAWRPLAIAIVAGIALGWIGAKLAS